MMRSEERGGGGAATGALALPAEPTAAAAASAAPHIAQVNVSSNSRLTIGPQFVSVTQNVHRDRVVKGRVLGLVLEAREAAAGGARRLRCSVAVCACWALAVAAALAGLGAWLALRPPANPRLDLPINASWYMRRGDWQALAAYTTDPQPQPAGIVTIGHSATYACWNRYNCTGLLLSIQDDHIHHGWADIGPNFLVGMDREEGIVFEGRGAGVLGAMIEGHNVGAVSVMWLGDYRVGHDAPTSSQLSRVAELLNALVAVGALRADYVVRAHCQLVPWMFTPGTRLLRRLCVLPAWRPAGLNTCLEWSACAKDPLCDPPRPEDPPCFTSFANATFYSNDALS